MVTRLRFFLRDTLHILTNLKSDERREHGRLLMQVYTLWLLHMKTAGSLQTERLVDIEATIISVFGGFSMQTLFGELIGVACECWPYP